MKITLIQSDIRWEDKKFNLLNLIRMFSSVPGDTDITVLPEMFTTGFSMNTSKLFEDADSDTYKWMVESSKKNRWALCGSYIVREKSGFFNRFLFVAPDGGKATYDKRHLFGIGGEDRKFSRGSKRSVFGYSDFRINPIICYDLRFPVWIRNRNDYDLLICVANWPESRREVWSTLLKARAIENQCYVAGVNRVGSDEAGNKYSGESVIIGPRGNVIASVPGNKEGVVSAEISLSELQDFREKFPVWKDSDDFEIL